MESIRLHSRDGRKIGDVMPFYDNGVFHLFYILNGSGHNDINQEHAFSRDLIHWEHCPPSIVRDPDDPVQMQSGCIFTGSFIKKDGLYHAFYTAWNPENINGREFICHAVSEDLISWRRTNDVLAPDGLHYSSSRYRDFRDPGVTYNAASGQYEMLILGNRASGSH